MTLEEGRQGVYHGNKKQVYVLVKKLAHMPCESLYGKAGVHGYSTLSIFSVLLLRGV